MRCNVNNLLLHTMNLTPLYMIGYILDYMTGTWPHLGFSECPCRLECDIRGEFKIGERQPALANAQFTPSHRDYTWPFWVYKLTTQNDQLANLELASVYSRFCYVDGLMILDQRMANGNFLILSECYHIKSGICNIRLI